MLAFTVEEFNKMIDELFGGDEPRYDTLAIIAKKTVYNYLKRKCQPFDELKSSDAHDDIFDNVFIKLRSYGVKSYFFRYSTDGSIHDGPEGFQKYLYVVASNAFNDYVKQNLGKTTGGGDDDLIDLPAPSTTGAVIDKIAATEVLAGAFDIVIESGISVYKILTWLAHGIIMCEGFNSMEAKRVLIDMFSEKSLDDMFFEIINVAEKKSWMEFSAYQKKKIENALDVIGRNKVRVGNIKYKDLYMAKGPQASVSDWINKTNSYVKGQMNNNSAVE